MIPVNKLQWSSERPKFEDVEGKAVLVNWHHGTNYACYYFTSKVNFHDFVNFFDDDFIRYAVIDLEQ